MIGIAGTSPAMTQAVNLSSPRTRGEGAGNRAAAQKHERAAQFFKRH
jgi:hypothetical protein